MCLYFMFTLSILWLLLVVYSQSYIRRTELLSFQNAEFLCLFLYDTHLSSIHNNTKNEEAKTICQSSTPCWIGLHDTNIEGTFLWSDLSPLDYGIPIGLGSGPWSAGNPDNYGTGEDCIHLIADSGWNDVPCSSQQHSLCNYPTLIYVFKDNKNYQRMPVASNIIGIMDILDEIYIEFKININSFISDSGYSNILHIGNTVNTLIPGISINKAEQKLHFSVSTPPLQNMFALSDIVELNTWYHIIIYIQMNHLKINVNDSIIYDESIASHQILTDQKIYLSDPWHVPAADVILSELIIATSNSNNPTTSASFNYFCDYKNRFTEMSGNWSIDENACILTKVDTGGGQITWLGDIDSSSKNWKNYKVELVYTINSGEDAGLIIRASSVGSSINSGQHYNIHLHIPNNEIVFAKIDNDFTELHGYLYPSNLEHDKEYTLRVEVYDNTFYVFLQNEYLFGLTDTIGTFTSGSIGIRDYHSIATYKSLRITFPTDNILYTVNPTISPSNMPTIPPTTNIPTTSPTNNPSNNPTNNPSNNPSNMPTYNPTIIPTISPTISPTDKLNEGGVTESLSTINVTHNTIISDKNSKHDIELYIILISVVSVLCIISCLLIILIYYKHKQGKNIENSISIIKPEAVVISEVVLDNDNNTQFVEMISDSNEIEYKNEIEGNSNIELEQMDLKTLPSEKTTTEISNSSSSEDGLFDAVNETDTTKGMTAGVTKSGVSNDNLKQQSEQRTKADSMYIKGHKITNGDEFETNEFIT